MRTNEITESSVDVTWSEEDRREHNNHLKLPPRTGQPTVLQSHRVNYRKMDKVLPSVARSVL